MKFEIIPNEQTPKVEQDSITVEYIIKNVELYNAFLDFAKLELNAVGLAANQCSLDDIRFNQRIFALFNIKTNEWKLIIDPKIVEYIGMQEEKLEGCLTWAGMAIRALRHRAIRMKYFDIDGNIHDEIFKGFDAEICQHEVNHLDGIPEEVVSKYYKILTPKELGRNDKCPCGSGKKYKQCCLLLI